MRCDKCQGLVINDYGDVRCMNCGRRPITDPLSIIEQRKEEPVPRFKSEETKQNWLAAMARRRKERGGEKKAVSESNVPAVRTTRAEVAHVLDIPVETACGMPLPGNVLSAIDAAIASSHADVAALQRTREILSRQSA